MALTSREVAAMKFDRAGRGYHRREVDQFRRLISGALMAIERNLGEPTGLSASDVEEVAFSMTVGGYDYEEVDEFLDRIARILRTHEAIANPPQRVEARPQMLPATELADTAFTVVFRGYQMRDVDQYIERVIQSLDAHETGTSTPLVDAVGVARKVFEISMRGYSEQEVDAVLDRAAKTLAIHEDQRRIRRSTAL